jgi:glycosyltransferase involved in cell wall biosynthesis
MTKQEVIFAVVVTFNRRWLLERCLVALSAQTLSPDRIIIVDNASTDGTGAWIRSKWLDNDPTVTYLRLEENLGGAGGFAEGMRHAFAAGADWVWMMDDDAEPEREALQHLVNAAGCQESVYGSIAISGPNTSWATLLFDDDTKVNGRVVDRVEDLPDVARVRSLPFLGFMINKALVERIGYPDAGFFIAGDDVEYCLRAGRAGARVYVVGKSRIVHPASDWYVVPLPGKEIRCLRLSPWKRYYDTRNRLLIAKRYFGLRMWTETVPAAFVRLFGSLLNEPRRGAQLWAFTAGFIDGLLGLTGKRHSRWHIAQ